MTTSKGSKLLLNEQETWAIFLVCKHITYWYVNNQFIIIYGQWEELYSSKPDDQYEDPADVAAIHEAKENMGDYKLKTALDYVVPDHLRMNVEKARGRLLVLKDQVSVWFVIAYVWIRVWGYLCVCVYVLVNCYKSVNNNSNNAM